MRRGRGLAGLAASLGLLLGGAPGGRAASRVDALLAAMTLEEKVGQMNLLTSDWDVTGPSIRGGYRKDIAAGKVGAIFNAYTAGFTRELQQAALEGSRHRIPLLFGYDVVHGHRTIFPVPLAEAASWDLAGIQQAARLAAVEATAEGIHWTFAPMVDVARDPRWGRIVEGAGEDVVLGARIAAARVRGFQGDDLAAPDTLAACAKHFAAYGAAQGGRDYHRVDLSLETLHDVYLPPFRAAVDAGVATVMAAFNDVNGVPCTAHPGLLQDVLRRDWDFDGLVVSDYTAINELVPHGFARDEVHAGALAAGAGIDMDMQGSVYADHLAGLVRSGRVPLAAVERSARRILELKERLGLFEDPFRYSDEARQRRLRRHPRHLAFARRFARECAVLLENRDDLLPLGEAVKRVALVGPLADSKRDLIGSWSAAGDGDQAVSLLQAFQGRPGLVLRHAAGCSLEGPGTDGFAAALEAAAASDVVVAVLGEGAHQSGEAASRTRIQLPVVQRELLAALVGTGKPVVLVVMSGRPLDLSWEAAHVPAILQAWFLGSQAGPALVDLLTGDASPAGRLPVSFPRSLGQVPLFHAVTRTGRPVDPARPEEKYRSRYLDSPNSPLYPFGYGLTYTRFEYRDLAVEPPRVPASGVVRVSATVTNRGTRAGTEVVQLYVRDRVGERTRPVRQLVDFQRLRVPAGGSVRVRFELRPGALAYSRGGAPAPPEPGDFDVFVAPDAGSGLEGSFRLE